MKAVPLIGIARHRLTIDGEGVTTLVAFHGCPLRCKYCLNPTSLQPNGVWESYNCNQLYEEVRKDELYFLASCGGVTFGGGEPLLQSEFIRQFRQLCGPEWRITVETSLNVPQQNVEELISIIDNYIIDIKDMNNDIYQRYTGKNNENVLGNLRYLIGQDKTKQIVIRTPLVPSYNTEKDIDPIYSEGIREQLEDYFYQAVEVELLLRLCPDEEDTIYQIVDLLVDTCSTKRKMLRIAGDDKPAEVVRSRLKKLNADHIRFVMDSLAENTAPVRNMKQYLLAMLYNAPTTMNLYYQNKTNHDFARGSPKVG